MLRREFIRNTGLSLGALALGNQAAEAAKKSDHTLGIQLYSVRDDMTKDPLGTLTQLAKMGYVHVEHASYVGGKYYNKYSATEFRKVLDDLGLKMVSGHSTFGAQHWNAATGQLSDSWKSLVADALIAGQKYVISPWLDASLRKDFDELKRFMEVFNKCGEYCKAQGIKFGYHNHDFEFSLALRSIKVYDIMLQNTEPGLVAQQLDIGNMYGGGGRAADLLKQYPGRFELMHVKDEIKTETGHGGYESAILGTGIIGVKDILKLGKKRGGTTQFIIEQESYQGRSPLDCMRDNLAIMRKWKY